ncbi:cyclase family protein [Actinomadura violacea]|uniref:Cyclase family protein n=1 Tax=Actinomadura violacea TaxID=2819934 RepID=A0ABS3RLG4_9ACTN|nr:cyclase family protein [Actinomadura violacea]MBO2457461.1 cyclase family protein [Actinomadura violacea]
MKLIDLSSPVDAESWEPDPIEHTIMTPAEGGEHMIAEMRRHFGLSLDIADLPGGEFLNNDTLTLTVHTGTHVDAPAHYGSTAAYGRPRTIDQMPLEWFHQPGVVLDLTSAGVGSVDADFIHAELRRVGHFLSPLDIVLLRTGAQEWGGTRRYFTDFTGLDGSAVHYLLDHGVKVIGTDAFSLDAPFPRIMDDFARTGDRDLLWPAHFAGREREYCQIERLANLDALPDSGFTVICFPVSIARAGAGWARAVAVLH